MIIMSHSFVDIARHLSGDVVRDAGAPMPPQAELDRIAERAASDTGLHLHVDEIGGEVVATDLAGRRVTIIRSIAYALVVHGNERIGADLLMRFVAATRGPGHIWTLAGRVHVIADDGVPKFDVVGDTRRARMRCVYAHERDARPIEP